MGHLDAGTLRLFRPPLVDSHRLLHAKMACGISLGSLYAHHPNGFFSLTDTTKFLTF
jgi:hypothetical protein